MKFICFFCLFSAMSFSSMGQSKTADEKTVSEAVDKLYKAMIDADTAALKDLTSDILSYGHSNEKVEDKKEFIESIASGRSDFVTINVHNQTIAVAGDVAIVRHMIDATTNDSGKPGSTKLMVIQVWNRENGHWRIWARQAVK